MFERLNRGLADDAGKSAHSRVVDRPRRVGDRTPRRAQPALSGGATVADDWRTRAVDLDRVYAPASTRIRRSTATQGTRPQAVSIGRRVGLIQRMEATKAISRPILNWLPIKPFTNTVSPNAEPILGSAPPAATTPLTAVIWRSTQGLERDPTSDKKDVGAHLRHWWLLFQARVPGVADVQEIWLQVDQNDFNGYRALWRATRTSQTAVVDSSPVACNLTAGQVIDAMADLAGTYKQYCNPKYLVSDMKDGTDYFNCQTVVRLLNDRLKLGFSLPDPVFAD